MTPDVSALIVTWNNEATLADCLAALHRELPPDSEILIFDNHSVDESPRIAERCGARMQVHDSNVGFAAGMNRLSVRLGTDRSSCWPAICTQAARHSVTMFGSLTE